jgi:FAD/FMN-containing dehydrogenase
MAADIDVAILAKSLEGQVLTPLDPAFDETRALWNGAIDRTPAVIARCNSDADVAEAIAFARRNDLTIAVHSGGHNVAGTASVDGGLVIDLSPMREVRVDPDAAVAVVAGGATLSDLDGATQAHGLATSMGVVSETGVAGLTLTGGMGWMRRRTGLSCDELVSARVVTADGSIVTASENENPDLFWGLRGGGGNFGVVTEFGYRCHPFPTEIPVALAYWPLADAERVLRLHAELMPERPEEWKATMVVLRPPVESGVPAELVGEPCLSMSQIWAGAEVEEAQRAFAPLREVEEAQRAFAPLRDVAPPAFEQLAPMPYLALQTLMDELTCHGKCNYTKGGYLDEELGDGAIAAMLTSAEEILNDQSMIELIPHGGAQLSLGDDDTAFPDRASLYSFNVFSRWAPEEDPEPHIAWARRAFQRLDEHAGSGVYVNFLNPDESDNQDRVLAAFGRRRYEKLAKLKRRYDPSNLFSLNPNVLPATTA